MKPETQVYKKLKSIFEKSGWFYLRLEQTAVPDIFVCRGTEFHFIEVKVGKSISDVVYQPGQLAFAQRITKIKSNGWFLCLKIPGKRPLKWWTWAGKDGLRPSDGPLTAI